MTQFTLTLRGKLVVWLVSMGARGKLATVLFVDCIVLAVAALLATLLTAGIGPDVAELGSVAIIEVPLITVAALYAVGAYRAVVRFIGSEFIERSAVGLLLAIPLIAALIRAKDGIAPAWQTLAAFFVLAHVTLTMVRLAARRFLSLGQLRGTEARVLIYGGGDAGAQMAAALQMRGRYRPVGFIDDHLSLHGRTILGLPVYSRTQLAHLKARGKFEHILLAIPSLTRQRRREILESLAPLAVRVLVVPNLEDIASGRKQIDDIREVQIEDLLDRDPVEPIEELLNLFIHGKSVMITGAGGSIGSELCRQAVKQGARKLVLFDMSEVALYEIDRELHGLASHCAIVPVLGSVLDSRALSHVMNLHEVETVYHAAAYKHVPLVESNVVAAVNNNVFGTLHAVQCAIDAGVRNFVLISTDKAVRPTNVMGASKRVCELIVQALAEVSPQTRMSMVRFGNVLASSGSVVPLFREQILRGGPVTVTHPDVTRYFMTIPEAAELVIQAGAMGRHGEVFVLEMGSPVKIRELAQRMIHLSGLEIRDARTGIGDIEIAYTGLRPGEKLYEELLIGSDPESTQHPRIFKASEAMLGWTELKLALEGLRQAHDAHAESDVIRVLTRLVAGFIREAHEDAGRRVAPTSPLPSEHVSKERILPEGKARVFVDTPAPAGKIVTH